MSEESVIDLEDLIIITPNKLKQIWLSYPDEPTKVIQFYSHISGNYRIFSNFYQHHPIPFTIPECCDKLELISSGRCPTFKFNCGEKAIMLCKASVMKDYITYDKILSETIPSRIKALGRQIKPWDQEKWDSLVCTIAFSVIWAKASNHSKFREILLSTENNIIAEATRNDQNWGIGIDMGKEEVEIPRRWRGTNILGWALMETRKKIEI